MTPRLLLEPEAEAEFLQAGRWYAERNPAIAAAFRLSVSRTLEAVKVPAGFCKCFASDRNCDYKGVRRKADKKELFAAPGRMFFWGKGRGRKGWVLWRVKRGG